MEQKENNGGLMDENSQKRLEELTGEWGKAPSARAFSAADLRLLLEHFSPLQELIRGLVVAPPVAAEVLGECEAKLQAVQAERRHAQDECQKALNALAESTARGKELEQSNANHKQDIARLNDEHEQLKKQLQQAREELSAFQSRFSAPSELELLRHDPQLARDMGLGDLPDDYTQALIQGVAVLAQLDSLERLWAVLKERCETDQRPASPAELALLAAVVAWHNHNWRERPYRLIEVEPSSTYHFDSHLRSRHTSVGETVAAQYLPGIADGAGNPLRKALVCTR